MDYQYFLANAFTSERYNGAQIAVFPDADGLSPEDMQRMASELNLSESVFVFSPINPAHNFKLSIYSPFREVHAGAHTLIAASYVLAAKGRIPLVEEHTPIQLENAGDTIEMHISQQHEQPTLMQYSHQFAAVIDHFVPTPEDIASMLSLEFDDLRAAPYQPLMVAEKTPYLIVPVKDLQSLNKARFDFKAWSRSAAPSAMVQEILLICDQTETDTADLHARLVGPQIGHDVDPPVGPALSALAGYLCNHQHVSQGTHILTVERGSDSSRKSLLHIEIDKKKHAPITMRVGGEAVMVGEGILYHYAAA